MQVISMCIILLVLIGAAGITVAEPKHVDGGWQRSDEVSQETPTAPPPDGMPAPTAAPPDEAGEPEAAAGTAWGYYAVAGVGGLFALTALWCWLRRAKR